MILTPDELKNLTALVEVGAKAVSHDKSLRESHAIQQTALVLLEKITKAHEPQPDPPVSE